MRHRLRSGQAGAGGLQKAFDGQAFSQRGKYYGNGFAVRRSGGGFSVTGQHVQAMAIDIYKRKPVFNNVFAGLSGPAILPIALRMVYQVCGAVQIPVVGLGGISSWQDAAAFLMAGATAVQVGTANFVKPDICLDIINGLEQFLKDQGCRSVDEIIGAARV